MKGLTEEEKTNKIAEMWKELKEDEKDHYKKVAEDRNERNKIMSTGTSASSSTAVPAGSSSIPPCPPPPLLAAPPPPVLPTAASSKPVAEPPKKKAKILKDGLGVPIEEKQRRIEEEKAYKKRMDNKVAEMIDQAEDGGKCIFSMLNPLLIAVFCFYFCRFLQHENLSSHLHSTLSRLKSRWNFPC